MAQDAQSVDRYVGPSEIVDPPANGSNIQQPPETADPAPAQADPEQHSTDGVDMRFVAQAVAKRDRATDVEASGRWNKGRGLFHGWKDKVVGALKAAYPVYLHLLHGGETAMEVLLKRGNRPDRKRRPKRGTEAVTAVEFVTKPEDNNQRKQCSEYATVLIAAATLKVRPEDFARRMKGKPLYECKAEVRAMRASLKPSKGEKREARANGKAGSKTETTKAGAATPAGGRPPLEVMSETAPAPLALRPGEWLMIARRDDGGIEARVCPVTASLMEEMTAILERHGLPVRTFEVTPEMWDVMRGLVDLWPEDGVHDLET